MPLLHVWETHHSPLRRGRSDSYRVIVRAAVAIGYSSSKQLLALSVEPQLAIPLVLDDDLGQGGTKWNRWTSADYS